MTLEELRSRTTVSVTEAASVLGISRTLAYESVREGAIPSLRLRGRVVIPAPQLIALLEGNQWTGTCEPSVVA